MQSTPALPPRLSTVLARLTDTAEAVINRPTMPAITNIAPLVQLHADVCQAVAAPREGPRIAGDHEIMLADVLIKIVKSRQGDETRTPLWCQIAGVLLPPVREDAWRAMFADHNARPATSEQDYAGGGA